MNKFIFLFYMLCAPCLVLNAQVAINSDGTSPHPNAMLDVQSDSKGMLVPRMTDVQRELLTSPTGLLVFDTSTNSFWFRDDNGWVELVNGKLSTLADEDGDTKIQVEEGADDDLIRMDINGHEEFVFKRNPTGEPTILLNNSSLYIGNESTGHNSDGQNNFVFGQDAFTADTTGSDNLAIGSYTLMNQTNGRNNIALGTAVLAENLTGSYNIGLGNLALVSNQGDRNLGLGVAAGFNNSNGDDNVFIGAESGSGSQVVSKSQNTMIGVDSGSGNDGSGNVFFGYRAGMNESGSNKLYVENSDTIHPLIYGEFDNDLLRVNGDLEVTGSFPTASLLQDADGDTKIQVEEGTDEDIIRFDVGGKESIIIEKNDNLDDQLVFSTSASDIDSLNIFIGDTLSGKVNTGIGNIGIGGQALAKNVIGNNNLALGHRALLDNNRGDKNIAFGIDAFQNNYSGNSNIGIGSFVGLQNSSGDRNVLIGENAGRGTEDHDKNNNVMIGFQAGLNNEGDENVFLGSTAGAFEMGSNRLYIENSSTATPLIYGEFDNDLVRINGDLEVTGSFPTSSLLEDADGDTKIQVEEGADEDIIRFDILGFEAMTLKKVGTFNPVVQLAFPSSGSDLFIGDGVGESIIESSGSTAIGYQSFVSNEFGSSNVAIGNFTLHENDASFNTALGSNSLRNNIADRNTGVGSKSLFENTEGENNVGLGESAGYGNRLGNNNVLIGKSAGGREAQHNKSNNVMVGHESGLNTLGSSNVFLGNQSGKNESGGQKLYIDNSATAAPLIYGEFDNDLVRINGDLEVTGDFPGKTIIEDADGDTKIQVEESADDDIIRFEIGGEQALKIEKKSNNNARLIFAPYDTDDINIFIGDGTTGSISTGDRNIGIGPKSLSNNVQGYINTGIGALTLHHNDTGVGNFAGSNAALYYNTSGYFNVGIGEAALFNNTTGFFNVGIGYSTGYRNQEGTNNVFIGSQAGEGTAFHNKSNNVMVGDQAGATNHGDANVFVGYQSGKNELGSNRLYIENSDSNAPLVYGEFDNDLLRVNGSLNINNAYTLPITDGNTTEVLQTDGSGTISWASISSATDNQMIDLFNLNGSNLELSLENDGQAMQTVDLSSVNTDNQTIDVLNLDGNTLELSLEEDGQATQTVNLSSINTDNQTIDVLNLDGNTLELSLEEDGQATQTVNLSSINTDNQTIDVLNLNGNTLELSMEDDGQATQTVNLTSINTDNQTIDVLNLNGNTLELSMEDDGQATQTVNLSAINTDNQAFDVFGLIGTTLAISLEDDGLNTHTINLAAINTDNQTIDVLSLNGSTLEISLQGDGQATQTVDLSSLVPIGTIQMWPTANPPDGWLVCDGSAITAANYPDLVGIIGTSLPDFNGRFALGSGENTTDFPTNHSLGSTGGQEKVALNAAQIPPHDHDVAITYREGEENGSGNSYSDLGGGSSSSKTFTTDSWGGNGGSTQSHENMPPFLTINYIIKAQ